MDKKIAGLLGAAAALTAVSGAQAAASSQTELAPATNYGDLLQPVPDAAAQLKADDAQLAERTRMAQVTIQYGHHHHHHHHRYFRHHHHHHHHHGDNR